MSKKSYKVLRGVKLDGKEHAEDSIVSLDTETAARLLGVFVEEATAQDKKDAKDGLVGDDEVPQERPVTRATTSAKGVQVPTPSKVGGKTNDGL